MTDTTERMTLAEALAAKKGTGHRAKPQQREQAEQIALFGWRNAWQGKYPRLKWLHSSGNGYNLSTGRARVEATRSGRTKGVWDVFLPLTKVRSGSAGLHVYGGLYIEMKDEGRKLAADQEQFRDALIGMYEFAICYSAQEAIAAICDYLGIDDQRVRVL